MLVTESNSGVRLRGASLPALRRKDTKKGVKIWVNICEKSVKIKNLLKFYFEAASGGSVALERDLPSFMFTDTIG